MSSPSPRRDDDSTALVDGAVAGLNAISRRVLGNAANMLAGSLRFKIPFAKGADKPAIGLTMFGVTTPCVNRVVDTLKDRYECFVFHATGTGGQTMEKLADSGRLVGVIDSTTTEVADLLLDVRTLLTRVEALSAN